MDALAFHPYPLKPLGTPGERFTGTMAEVRRAMARKGDRGRRIWITEVGLPVGAGATPEEQARTLQALYNRLAADGDVDAVLFHTLLDELEETGFGSGFGWLVADPDGKPHPRPVYREFARRG